MLLLWGFLWQPGVLEELSHDRRLTNTTAQPPPQPAVLGLRVASDGVREGRLSPSAPVSDPQSLQEQNANHMTAVPSRKIKRWSEGFWKSDPSDHNLQLCSVRIPPAMNMVVMPASP